MRACSSNCKEKDEAGNCLSLGTDSLPVQCIGHWALDKYYFLEQYLDATRSARKKFSEKSNAVYIDLFAGPGRCVIRSQDREIDNGSLRILNNIAVPFNEYHFFDISGANIDAFKVRVGERPDCFFHCGDSNFLIDDLVGTLLKKEYRYHFAYIDPFGPDGLKFSTIRALGRLKRIDLLIHFPIGAIRRNIKKWQDNELNILDEFLGTKDWRKSFADLRHRRMLMILLDIYREQLLQTGFPEEGLKMASSAPGISASLPVVSIRNAGRVELYVLVLASKHPIAQKIWNSVIRTTPNGQRSLLLKWKLSPENIYYTKAP